MFIENLYRDNIIGVAIYSIPELLLLKANQMYIDFQDFPYNDIKNSIGKSFKERVNGFEESKAEEVFKDIIKTGISYYPKEYELISNQNKQLNFILENTTEGIIVFIYIYYALRRVSKSRFKLLDISRLIST